MRIATALYLFICCSEKLSAILQYYADCDLLQKCYYKEKVGFQPFSNTMRIATDKEQAVVVLTDNFQPFSNTMRIATLHFYMI